ncbi:MAG: GTP-binding protein [Pseudorhodoplanes sp.]|nr:GTP-binding protein [Pseudorhodoplanes sp.]
MKHTRGTRIPVTVVTGFLGAGKSTLVKHFLQTPEGRGTAIVVNEFGAAGIDDALLRSSSDETVLLGNGCLCCNVRSDLQLALHRLVSERERGQVPYFHRMVIETSGLADPGPILRTFATDRALGGEFHIGTLLTVVDAVTGISTLSQFPEARRQVMLADRLMLSKTDLADAAAVQNLTSELRRLNPHARIDLVRHGRADPACFVEELGEGRMCDYAAEVVHGDDIKSFVLTEDTPIDWAVFARAMDTLVALRGFDLLRAKGILDVKGCQGPVVVQFVQHLAHPPVELAAWPDQQRGSRMVFIVRNVDERQVRALFEAVRGLARERDTPSITPRT